MGGGARLFNLKKTAEGVSNTCTLHPYRAGKRLESLHVTDTEVRILGKSGGTNLNI